MPRSRPTILACAGLFALTLVAGCGGDSTATPGSPNPSSSTVATEVPTYDAASLAAALQDAIPEITEVETITAANDPNQLLGTAGGYDAAVSVHDSRASCEDDLEVACGARIEHWHSGFEARSRIELIQSLAEEQPPFAEWDFHSGPLLLRVSHALSRTDALAYRDVLLG